LQERLPSGIPSEQSYRSLIESDMFKNMESFSDSFLSENNQFLDGYIWKWVKDPLHQWSRQWEYPFVLSRVESIIKKTNTVRILDAGSGITFFPYYIKSLNPLIDVHCVDIDEKLKNNYDRINTNGKTGVKFSSANLKKTPFENEWFDIVYCISVLEHTNDYGEIIDEFYRILRPDGRLVITFDVSLDGTRHISIDKGTILLKSLAEKFIFEGDMLPNLSLYENIPDIFTTHTAKSINTSLLPWRLPYFVYQLRSLTTGKRIVTWPPLLTVFCISMQKSP